MRVLSLGGGQQSTAVYLLAANGEIPALDYAIFADTGEEPSWVYDTVSALGRYRTPAGTSGAPILVRSLTDAEGHAVRLGDHLVDGNEGRFASIPAFIKHLNLYERGKLAQGKGRRQCTREFKTAVVEAVIRREILGLSSGERFRGDRVTQVFGLDYSEGERIFRVKGHLAVSPLSVGDFPLWDLRWSRSDCVSYLAEVPGWGREVLPSACTFCPLAKDSFRRLVRERDPAGWARACAVDEGMRRGRASVMLDGELYVHRSMVPLSEVDIDGDAGPTFGFMQGNCEGFCGH